MAQTATSAGKNAGKLLRDTRRRHGLSQHQLAYRANTHQSAISRIEGGKESPSFERLEQLLFAMGERLTVTTNRIDHECDPVHLAAHAKMSPSERLALAFGWSRFNRELQGAARR